MVGRGLKSVAATAALSKAYAKIFIKFMKKYSISWLLLSYELHAEEKMSQFLFLNLHPFLP